MFGFFLTNSCLSTALHSLKLARFSKALDKRSLETSDSLIMGVKKRGRRITSTACDTFERIVSFWKEVNIVNTFN